MNAKHWRLVLALLVAAAVKLEAQSNAPVRMALMAETGERPGTGASSGLKIEAWNLSLINF